MSGVGGTLSVGGRVGHVTPGTAKAADRPVSHIAWLGREAEKHLAGPSARQLTCSDPMRVTLDGDSHHRIPCSDTPQ